MKMLASLAFTLATAFAAASPVADLQRENPTLASLLSRYSNYRDVLEKYARQQGFRNPYELQAVVIHEILHIDSAAHQGYFIDGIYYEPYISQEHWPSLRNSDIAPLMRPEERGLIHSVYMQATPLNHLGNILDEVNAYTHVLPFVCKHEPTSALRQIGNLIGHLNVVEAYLRVARTKVRSEYDALRGDRLSSGALNTITQRAWLALTACGLPLARIPHKETIYFTGAISR